VHLFLSLEELQHLQPFLMLWIKLRRRVVAVKVFHHVFLHNISARFSYLEKEKKIKILTSLTYSNAYNLNGSIEYAHCLPLILRILIYNRGKLLAFVNSLLVRM